jgi:hypothetical protein
MVGPAAAVAAKHPNLYGLQEFFVPPPMQPQGGAAARDDEIAALFREVSRLSTEVASVVDGLRALLAVSPRREIGPGHNQGPPFQAQDLDDPTDLIALLKDKGPRPHPVDIPLIVAQTKKTFGLAERIREWVKTAAISAATIGAHETTKDVTGPIWEELAHKIVALCHAIQAWIEALSSLVS